MDSWWFANFTTAWFVNVPGAPPSATESESETTMDSWWFANFTTAWFIIAPLIIVAAYVAHRLLRSYLNHHVWRHARAFLSLVDPYVTVDVARRDADDECSSIAASTSWSSSSNAHYADEVKAYLSAACSREARALRAEGAVEGDGLVLSLHPGQEVADEFRGAVLWWSCVEAREEAGVRRQDYRLTFHRRHRQLVVDEYLPHVRRKGREALFVGRHRRLYTNDVVPSYGFSGDKVWNHIDFKHPTTFDTLAMDPAKKKEIMDDLDAFRSNVEFFKRTGKPWKRGYLLYGPPGTGKSTMVAAMASYLNYDIYDVEFTVVRHNHDLRKLLAETTDKSIVVIEDIDCSLDLTGKRRGGGGGGGGGAGGGGDACYYDDGGKPRRSRVTLSGLLNFIDGLWSSCGGERIVVFTTNHVDRLDPALIRRGRMDMHVEMSYCGFDGFRTLARNYLGVDDHPLFDAVEELLQEVKITPADVAECLMTSTRAGRGVESSLEHLIEEVKKAKEKAEAADAEAVPAATPAAAGADKSAGETKGRRRRNRRKKQEEKHGDTNVNDSVVTKES